MSLPRECAERHTAGGEALHDGLNRLDLLEGDRLAVRDHLEHVADGSGRRGGERLLEQLVLIKAGVLVVVERLQSLMEHLRHRGRVLMVLLLLVILDEAVVVEAVRCGLTEGSRMPLSHLLREVFGGETADTGRGAAEGHVDQLAANTNGLEDLSAVVRREKRDANLGEDLQHAGLKGLTGVGQGGVQRNIVQLAGLAHLG
mmetsp:Transcript_14155/g.43326  ORF Transcript_14155/g.43326 Transcript_14155/m.43326 type:complete len:201 (+) Transcript_14155:1632-2234(+)